MPEINGILEFNLLFLHEFCYKCFFENVKNERIENNLDHIFINMVN